MSARTFVVVVEQRTSSKTVGPYHSFTKAEADSKAWDGINGCKTWVEPVVRPEDYQREASVSQPEGSRA